MNYETIIYQKADNIARITLNRPEVLNAINRQVMAELLRAIGEASRDNDVRVLVLTGAGRAFCAGGDFKYLGAIAGTEEPEAEAETGGEPFPEGIILGLRRMGKPVIAMVNGPAAGFGSDLALACDMRIGSDKARFVVAFTKIGLAPVTGTCWMLPRVVGVSKACRLIFTGDTVGSEEAYQMGILDELVPSDKLEEETMALARKLAQGPPIAIGFDKTLIYRGVETDLETSLKLSGAYERLCTQTEDFKEALKAFAEKKQPMFRGK